MAYAKIRLRRGTLYEWSTYNPVLESGEIALEYPDTGLGTGLCKFKVGDGVTKYTELAYAFDGTSAASIDGGTISAFSVIQLRRGTGQEWYNVNPILNLGEMGYDTTVNSIKVGDGVKSWNELEYICAGSMVDNEYDFGNENDDDIYGNKYQNMEHDIEGGVDYPDHILPDGWDDNIDSGEPAILGSEVPAPTEGSVDVDVDDSEDPKAGLSDLLDEE